jgi:hypothetical protein
MKQMLNNFQEGRMIFSDGILRVEYKPQTIINETVLLKQIIYRKCLTKNENFFMIADLKNVSEVTDEAMELAASNPSPEHIKAIAMITHSGMDHMRARLYSMFDRPNILTRVFLNETDALLWFGSLESEGYEIKKAG